MIDDKKIELIDVSIDKDRIKKSIVEFYKMYNSELSIKYFRNGHHDDGSELYKSFMSFYLDYEENLDSEFYTFCEEIEEWVKNYNKLEDIGQEQKLEIFEYYTSIIVYEIVQENSFNLDDYKTLKWLLQQFYNHY